MNPRRDMMIPRVTRSEFADGYLARGRPAIITDALDAWRIAERWTPEALARNVAPSRRVTLSASSDGRYRFEPAQERSRAPVFRNTEVEFGAAVARLLEADQGEHIYLLQQSIPEVMPELLDQLVVPEWIAAQRPMINLWFGRGTETQLHFDYSNNFFAQLHGTKDFTLFSPDDTPHLYPYHHDAATAHLSNVDPGQPDLARHPAFARAEPLRFTMQPGELLYMPVFWWHHVRARDVSVSVNFWWYPSLRQIIDAPNATRALPGFYAGDRLAEFRAGFLDPAGLDFAQAGARFLEHGRLWGAGLLAIAALDQWGRQHAAPDAPARPAGSRLADLAADLAPVRAALLADASLSPSQREAVTYSAVLAAQLAEHHEDAVLDRGAIAALLDLLRAVAPSAVQDVGAAGVAAAS
ncbi:hypothetical protein BGL_1c11800 [Burkholderia plantarii]|uniref:JmjC domain-containing protein n=2 Tax=Burkholderia plantarii TaxID=41899 RepID=A0A0B6RK47_BURPL|nr:hypothetical protein BGL_1c11800 [Burkholderia plantarii]